MSNSEPVISVLIACHNAASYVGAAVESVLAQTWPWLEVVVVDDGSTDCSVAAVASFEGRGVRVIQQANAGAAAARNRALAASSAPFVLFLDADDLISPDHLASLHAAIAGAPRSIAMSQWDRFSLSPDEAVFPPRATYRDAPGAEWLAQDWAQAGAMTQCGMFLIPRALLALAGGWDERLTLIDDFEFYARVIAGSAGVRFAPSARLYYRSGLRGSLSGQKSRKAAESAFLSLMLGTRHLLAAENSPRTRLACANVLQSFDYTYYPGHADLRAKIRARVAELGGSDLAPDGPPGFQAMRRFVGWHVARRVQHLAERLRLNGAVRRALAASRLSAAEAGR
jgi:glycosyltransferase involved in cell wall biosynthesis